MKLNNKGFAISTVMYIILIMAVILITLTLTLLSNRKLVLDKIKSEVMGDIYQSGLPEEYQQVEYIESTGTQYIDTNYIPKTTTKLELDLSFNGTYNHTGNIAFAGVYDGDITYSLNFGGSANQSNEIYVWADKSYNSGATIYNFTVSNDTLTNRNLFILESGNVSYGDNQVTVATKTTNQTSSLVIFGRNIDNVKTPFSGYNMRLYGSKIYENDILLRDYIPCYRISDRVIGLYDLVNDVFYTNAGTGIFIKGSNITQQK